MTSPLSRGAIANVAGAAGSGRVAGVEATAAASPIHYVAPEPWFHRGDGACNILVA
jgi:hypothetical protein